MSESKPIYKQNVERIREFYESDYFTKIKNEETRLKDMIKALYDDPDKYDCALLDQAKKYSEEYGVEFSPDGICSWGILFDVYGKNEEGRETADWLDKYEIIRKSRYGTLFFPCRMGEGRSQTINQYKGTHYADRIDYTLFVIKNYLDGKENCGKEGWISNLSSDTKEFFDKFKRVPGGGGFEAYVKAFNLEKFTKGNNEIIILGKETNLDDGFVWSNRYSRDDKKEKMKCYLDNLCELCKKDTEP